MNEIQISLEDKERWGAWGDIVEKKIVSVMQKISLDLKIILLF